MSHIEALSRGWQTLQSDLPDVSFAHYNLRRFNCQVREEEKKHYQPPLTEKEIACIMGFRERQGEGARKDVAPAFASYIDTADIAECYQSFIADCDAAVFCIEGNEHNLLGLVEIVPVEQAINSVKNGVRVSLRSWFELLSPVSPARKAVLFPPPPNGSEEHIRKRADRAFQEKLKEHPLRSPQDRLRIWREQCAETARVAREFGLEVIDLPADVLGPDGLMAVDCYGNDATHGNEAYGQRVLRHVLAKLHTQPRTALHPYSGMADHAYWRQAVSDVPSHLVDPVVNPHVRIGPQQRVATAGSCFAQHISKRLRAGGFNYYVAETADSSQDAEQRGFYDFSARYGNVYTARQLLQLFDRAFGYFRPMQTVWERPDGRFCDPFRPRIEPNGFPSAQAVEADSQAHLAAVRRMFMELDVLVFTLGLTECWRSRLDGAVYPVCPGVAGGTFNPDEHEFVNFNVTQVVADMSAFLAKLQLVNPSATVVLTVSPVPLAATRAQDRHVLVSTTYSKSVLRVAAEEIAAGHAHVQYFPSYEIITGSHANYFAADRRSVTEAGVDHVMRVFMSRMTEGGGTAAGSEPPVEMDPAAAKATQEMQAILEACCDEELYARK